MNQNKSFSVNLRSGCLLRINYFHCWQIFRVVGYLAIDGGFRGGSLLRVDST